MIEIVVIVAMLVFVVACGWPLGGSAVLLAKDEKLADQTAWLLEENLSEGSATGNQFLAQLQHEIEVALFPRPTDSVLKRHYDSLVAAKLEDRLAQMPI